MNKNDIIEYFDSKAATWDESILVRENIIETILDNADVSAGMDILDVACGTGVMIPFYLKRNVRSITAIDLSPKMARLAGAKFQDDSRVNVIQGDVTEHRFNRLFDRIIVYNAFPHFAEPEGLIKTLSNLLNENGRLSICHGLSRERINSHHDAVAKKISRGLMSAEELSLLFSPYFDVDITVSNDEMYQVSGSMK